MNKANLNECQKVSNEYDDCTIERCDANSDFTILPNSILQHPTMSADAQMVITYLLSCKPDWVIKPRNIWKAKNISRDHVYRAFDELMELGYMEKIVTKLGNLKSSVKYKVSYLNKFLRRSEIQDTEIQYPENQDALIRTIEKKNDIKKVLSCTSPSASVFGSSLSDNKGIFESNPLPSSAVAADAPKPPEPTNRIDEKELYRSIIRAKKDWTADEIAQAIEIIELRREKVIDHLEFMDGIIDNIRIKIAKKNIKLEKKDAINKNRRTPKPKASEEEEKIIRPDDPGLVTFAEVERRLKEGAKSNDHKPGRP